MQEPTTGMFILLNFNLWSCCSRESVIISDLAVNREAVDSKETVRMYLKTYNCHSLSVQLVTVH
jgi:hypothetical protein